MALDDTIGLLAQAPIVGLFERDALRLLAFSAEHRRLRPNEALFRRGERTDGGYVVVSGRLGVTARAGDATPDIVAGPGSLVGRTALFVRTVRPADAVALEPSEVLRISPTLMRRVLAEFPAAAVQMHEAMSQDLAELSTDLERVRQLMLRPDRP